jgi:hypothetical protein
MLCDLTRLILGQADLALIVAKHALKKALDTLFSFLDPIFVHLQGLF